MCHLTAPAKKIVHVDATNLTTKWYRRQHYHVYIETRTIKKIRKLDIRLYRQIQYIISNSINLTLAI